jgi:hypothetical protein
MLASLGLVVAVTSLGWLGAALVLGTVLGAVAAAVAMPLFGQALLHEDAALIARRLYLFQWCVASHRGHHDER